MDEHQATLPLPPGPPAAALAAGPGALVMPRWWAALQVFLVSGIPTQLAAASAVAFGAGIPLIDPASGGIAFEFIAVVSLVDTALIALLIRLFLILSSEQSGPVFVGTRPIKGEVLLGLALLPVAFLAVTGVVLLIRAVAPGLHTVSKSPFEAYMASPLTAGIFLLVAVLAGGVREELQRGFILHRFEQRLGGVRLGLALFTILFGALHVDQGLDVAIAVGLLGLFWGVMYIRRQSVVLSMVNHASFNAAQVLQAVLARTLGA
ncbi:MAG: CPBP family intramembrane metalloprotease [Acidobacteria bacterium]|nr:CPBP family intramembrane metalloprotease [Acidobacteriota bacterium]